MALITLSNGAAFEAESGASILDGALANGVVLEHSCRTGRCGSCKARVIDGRTVILRQPISLTSEEVANGWVLTCASEAVTGVRLDIEDIGVLAGIKARVVPARVDCVELLARDVVRIELRLPPRSTLKFLAGQYVDVTGPSGLKRSYSIASAAAITGRIELQIRRVEGGQLSAYWFDQAKINDLLRFNGPRGTFFLRPVAGLDLIFLATGTGIAPICSMLAQLAAMPSLEQPRSISLYWGGRSSEDLYLDPAEMLAGLRYVPVLSRGDAHWAGARGYIQDVLLHHVFQQAAPPLACATVYACGSEAMIHGARTLLADNGLPVKRFHFDAFVSSN